MCHSYMWFFNPNELHRTLGNNLNANNDNMGLTKKMVANTKNHNEALYGSRLTAEQKRMIDGGIYTQLFSKALWTVESQYIWTWWRTRSPHGRPNDKTSLRHFPRRNIHGRWPPPKPHRWSKLFIKHMNLKLPYGVEEELKAMAKMMLLKEWRKLFSWQRIKPLLAW